MSPLTLHPLFRDEPRRRLVGIGRDETAVLRLREQYATARAHGDRLAELFYDRLFRLHPQLRPMFRTDPSVQQSKLMDSLDAVMAYLDRPDEQALLLIEMGRRHAAYGAAPAHYRIVAELLSDAVTELLGDKADAQTRQDWLDAFNLVSDHMLAGAETPEA